ncbi:hypothetical protein OAN24_01830 [Pseudodesulfovibrio sp.]|nr:hypothetical protein [Pseudodesulfovibrio sp.]
MTMNETLTIVAYMLAPAFFSLLGIAAFGSPVVALLSEIAAKTKSTVLYDKYGQQTGAMGLVLLALLLMVDIAAIGVAYVRFPQLIQTFMPLASAFFGVLIAMGCFVVFSLIYFLTWKKMRQAKGLHLMLGGVAALASILCIALGVPAKLMIGLPAEVAQAQVQLDLQSMIVPMAVMYTILTLSAAAGLSCVYLVLRRNKDDFGRDYYNFALKLAARWATLPMFGFLACQGWLFAVLPENFRIMTLGTPLGIIWAVGTGLGVICAIIWILIARSTAPLQLKGLTFLAAGLLWLMHVANSTVFVNFMTMF